jgi:chaperonin GroES
MSDVYPADDGLMPEDAALEDDAPEPKASGVQKLIKFAQAEGDISDMLEASELAKLGADVVADWKRDDGSRSEWKAKVEEALKKAAQDPAEAKDYPWPSSSNVQHPILTVASQQFAARAYPAIVKGDEAVKVKVLGLPPQPPPAEVMQAAQAGDPTAVQMAQAMGQAQQRWNAKRARAHRVETYLNYLIFYAMEDWEGDTDALLHNIPITGAAFRKVWWDADEGKCCAEFVNPLRLTIPMDSQSLRRCPRITQDFDLYPYEITQKQRAGVYREITLTTSDEDEQKPRLILEQHRLHDLDGDGVEEPYVVTVDAETSEVLRIDAAFGMNDVEIDPQTERILSIRRWVPFVKYTFLPDPKGRAYGIGFGHLLGPLSDVINTVINQLLDAGHAQVAGGGFIASGLRLQGAGQTNVLKFRPGEYKTVNIPGAEVKNAIVEVTRPSPSPVLFELLDLILGAAKEIASIKDVLTGDTPSTAPVGTTLALIEQGLQVFTSIYKRIYRSLREEFQLLYECERRYGSPDDYAEVLDDPMANFEADFTPEGKDILPVSDPTAVTKMQSVAKAQGLQALLGVPGANPPEMLKEIIGAIGYEDPERFIMAPQPNPMADVQAQEVQSKTAKNRADALKSVAQAAEIHVRNLHGPEQGVVPGMAGSSPDAMGDGGLPIGGPGPAGGMDAAIMGQG